jgi:arginyl-tRNA synthetase
MKEKLSAIILQSLQQAFPELATSVTVHFQVPKDKSNGDLSTNIAMQLAKQVHKTPREVADVIVRAINAAGVVASVEVAGAGFINLFLLKEDVFSKLDAMVAQQENYGQRAHNGGKLNLEFVSVNPTGDLHIGHARGAVYGDVIANLLRKTGYDVTKEYYINDAGSQITKLGLSVQARYRQLQGEDVQMPEDGYHAHDIIDIAQVLVDAHTAEITQLTNEDERLAFFSDFALAYELKKIKQDLSLLNITHDVWFSERTLYQDGSIDEVLERLKEREMVYEEDGALWLKSTLYGDDKDRVLIKSDGSYTYLTPDISYHVNKLDRLASSETAQAGELIDILGGDHHGYVARMKAALQALGYREDILRAKLIQMVRFMKDGQEVKMSKRSGNLITLRELVAEVGPNAVRYYFTMRSCDTPLDFDMTLAQEESSNNPVYYAQYAYARIASILRKAEAEIDEQAFESASNYELLVDEKERALANKLNQYEDMLLGAANRLEPFKVTNYIQELAATFHAFYNAVHVIDTANIPLSVQRIRLLLATKGVLRSAFAIVGIDALETM